MLVVGSGLVCGVRGGLECRLGLVCGWSGLAGLVQWCGLG